MRYPCMAHGDHPERQKRRSASACLAMPGVLAALAAAALVFASQFEEAEGEPPQALKETVAKRG